MPAGPALLVEVEIDSVAGISVVAAPYLDAGLRVTREERDVSRGASRAREIRPVERRMLAIHFLFERDGNVARDQLVRAEADVGLDQVRVDEEEVDAILSQGLLHTVAQELTFGARGAVGGNRVAPESTWAITALGQPDPPRLTPEEPLMRRDPDAHLRADGS